MAEEGLPDYLRDEHIAWVAEMQAADPSLAPPGAALLDDVEAFLARFVAYPSEAARVAHVLWIAHTLVMATRGTRRRASRSCRPSRDPGRRRALEVTEPLVPRPVHAVNITPAYLFRKVSDEEGPPTILYDEIDTVFGPKAKDNEDVRGMLNAGHRRGAIAGRCVVRGKMVETEELPAYCAVALAGLDDLPDTIMTRSVDRADAPARARRAHRAVAAAPQRPEARTRCASGSRSGRAIVEPTSDAGPTMPAGIEDRDADVWEALLAVADLAGGSLAEPRPCCGCCACYAPMARTAQPRRPAAARHPRRSSPTASGCRPTEHPHRACTSWTSPHGRDLRGKPIDARWLARHLGKYDVKPKVIRIGKTPPVATKRPISPTHGAGTWSRRLPTDPQQAQQRNRHPRCQRPSEAVL